MFQPHLACARYGFSNGSPSSSEQLPPFLANIIPPCDGFALLKGRESNAGETSLD
jgi:hypothetical protein